MKLLILSAVFWLVNGCSKPTATVFEDRRLAQEETVKICLIGDLGQETDHQRVMAEALEREECHRIFFLGDLVYPAGIDSLDDPEIENKFLRYYQPLLDRNPSLVIGLMLGNHDHQGTPSVWKDFSKKNEGFFFPNYYYFIDYGGLCMVALDTSFYMYNEQVMESLEQSKWLMELESRLKNCDVKVALSHHPFKGGGYSGSKDWKGAEGAMKVFLDTYVIGKFDMHIAGHVHLLADDGKDEGTRMLISGTGGGNRGDGASGYVVLRWEPSNPKKIGYSLRNVDTIVNVFDASGVQKQEASLDWEEAIEKNRVEDPWYHRILKFFD